MGFTRDLSYMWIGVIKIAPKYRYRYEVWGEFAKDDYNFIIGFDDVEWFNTAIEYALKLNYISILGIRIHDNGMQDCLFSTRIIDGELDLFNEKRKVKK